MAPNRADSFSRGETGFFFYDGGGCNIGASHRASCTYAPPNALASEMRGRLESASAFCTFVGQRARPQRRVRRCEKPRFPGGLRGGVTIFWTCNQKLFARISDYDSVTHRHFRPFRSSLEDGHARIRASTSGDARPAPPRALGRDTQGRPEAVSTFRAVVRRGARPARRVENAEWN